MDEPKVELSQDEFIEGIRKHRRWLDGNVDDPEAVRAEWSKRRIRVFVDQVSLASANLAGADLSGSKFAFIDLSDSDLTKSILDNVSISFGGEHPQAPSQFCRAMLSNASLQCASLRGASFRDADLRGADLSGSDVQECDFSGARLQGSNLRDANLQSVRGLHAYQLAGTDLTGAKLPEAIRDFKGLETAAEAVRSSQKLLLTILAGCFYCGLTLASTTHASLFGHTASTTLPLFQTNVPIGLFMVMAPALLLAAYIYLHFSMMDVWTAWASLPAVFPDGRPVYERLFPWIANSLAQINFERLRTTSPWEARIRGLISSVALWWIVPIAIALFWARCLILRDASLTWVQVALLSTSVLVARLSRLTMQRTLRTGFLDLDLGRRPGLTPLEQSAVSAGWATICLMLLFFGSFSWATLRSESFKKWSIQNGLSFFTRVNLDGQVVSTIDKPQDYDSANWEDATAWRIQAAGARLISTNLREAEFPWGDFRKSVFLYKDDDWHDHEKFFLTIFREASFREARLSGVDFRDTCYDNINLQGAYLDAPSLKGFCLECARNWILATLDEKGLSDWELGGSAGLERTKFSDEQLSRLRIKDFFGCDFNRFPRGAKPNLSLGDLRGLDFEGAVFQDRLSLRGANLSGVNLHKAQLKGADLFGANVEKTDFRGANLCLVEGLTIPMARQALFDNDSKLPAQIATRLGLPTGSCDSQMLTTKPSCCSSCGFSEIWGGR